MFKIRHRVAFAALVCVGICALAACDDAPEPQEPAAAAKKDAPQKAPNIASDMVAAVSAGKASSVISVHFALRAPPSVNTPLPVEVSIVPHSDFSSVIVHFSGQEGLAAATGGAFGPKTDVKSENPLSHQLVLLPTQEGMFVITAAVETEGAEGNVTRIFSIPVVVAPAAAKAPPAEAAGTPDKG